MVLPSFITHTHARTHHTHRPQQLPMSPIISNAMPSSLLLELAAADDLAAFRRAVHDDSLSLVAAASWYGPTITTTTTTRGTSTRQRSSLALHLRTPAMVAALYGSTNVLSYILSIAPSEASRASSTDGATPLHLAKPASPAHFLLLRSSAGAAAAASSSSEHPSSSSSSSPPLRSAAQPAPIPTEKKKIAVREQHQPADDINGGVFATDEFRMYSFKVNPCSRAYTHDWTECPFAHPGENARRRDPRRFSYTCVPCPEFRKDPASCRSGDACEYAHGVFESWLHPAQYRTRLCKDDLGGCPRRICFFAHGAAQLRAVDPSALSAAMSSSSSSSSNSPSKSSSNFDMPRSMPRPALTSSLSSREMDFDLDRYNKHRLLSLAAPPAPRTSQDYSDLLTYVQALSSLQQQQKQQQQAGGDISLMLASAHKPPLGSRATAFAAQRSQSFVDRAPGGRSFVTPASTTGASSVLFSNWGSPDGKPDWGVRGAELRKSTSFGISTSSEILAARCWSDLEQMVA